MGGIIYKNAIKEIVRILLLIMIIILTLGIIIYEYVPNNKKVPKKLEEYTLEEEIKNEINTNESLETEKIVKTYKIEGADLQVYEYEKNYEKGKVNPFSVLNTETENTTSNTVSNENPTNTTTTNNNTSSANTTNNSETNESKDQFFNTVGK